MEVEGIGPAYAVKLEKAGITTTEALLEKGASPKGRKEMAEKSGVDETMILKWVNHVDLMRIDGVGPQYAELLEAAGVDTVVELSKRKPENLVEKMLEVNETTNKVNRPPALSMVEKWVAEAKTMPRAVHY